jgi:trimeric autotransporter adhesin
LWLPLAGLALAGLSFSSRLDKNAKLPAFLFCALLVVGLVFQTACGGGGTTGGGGGGTPPGTYTITVTATSGSLHHSTAVTLKVQSLNATK